MVTASIFEGRLGQIPDCAVHGYGDKEELRASLQELGAIPRGDDEFRLRIDGNLVKFDMNEREVGQISLHLVDVPEH